MARITIASQSITIAALNARLDVATEVYRNQRARIAELEAQLATPSALRAAPTAPVAQSVVTTYTDRAGNVWEKTRTGNRATSRIVDMAEAA